MGTLEPSHDSYLRPLMSVHALVAFDPADPDSLPDELSQRIQTQAFAAPHVTAREELDARSDETIPTPVEGGELVAINRVLCCFMFPPVGWQHVNMGKALYDEVPVFREALNQCAEVGSSLLPMPLIDVLYPEVCDEGIMAEVIHTA